ncbi:hypothetical protein [Streptomyces phytophilus]|uniref:hypothetical protein n=1 Tax=Streptomyces phytophilus TaxID=722715 RepID=UPI0015F0235E|nr:hypothetical protein [Streptomyces phytophilus]
MQHIFHDGKPVAQGETFEPKKGYTVTFVRMEEDRLILRDSKGEFSRPIRDTRQETREPAVPRLGERRTALKEIPDSCPIEGETLYLMTHQMCVPGGWESLATQQLRAPRHLAGIYGPAGQMLEDRAARGAAAQLFESASSKIVNHPYVRLRKLVATVHLQEGTEGEPGAWDDPGVAMEICQILRDSKTL